MPIELNKLEGTGQGVVRCRVFFVVQNPDVQPIEQFRLSLVLFGTDGVIARRVAFDVAPLAAGKLPVRLFDLQGIGCDGIGRVLVNDGPASCHGRAGPDQVVYGRGDRALPYGAVMATMGVISAAGFARVCLLAEQSAPPR